MKKVLIQDRFASDEHINTLTDLLFWYIKDPDLRIEMVGCLKRAQNPVTDYDLIISHPHVLERCCVPLIEHATREKIPVVLTYKINNEQSKIIKAISENFKLKTEKIEGYYKDVFSSIILEVLYQK
jgi:hypothetical protein